MNGTFLILSLLLAWPFSGVKDYRMTAGAGVPAATGNAKVQRDKGNGNTKIELKVEHLANPASLTPPATTYLVWVRANGGAAVKQGAIRVGKDLKGELKIVTISKDFDILVTAEQGESVTEPSSVEVLKTHVNPL